MAFHRRALPEAPTRDAAEVVAAIADRLRLSCADVAEVDLKYIPSDLSDLVVTTTTPGAVGFSIVGLAGLLVFTISDKSHRRWEIENNNAGRADLERLIWDVIEGRMSFSRWPFRPKGRYLSWR